MWEIVLDSLLDCLKMLPFIFLTYVVIELIERKATFAKNGRFLTGKFAPVFGSLAGAFPSCGVSVMSAKLYDKKLIGAGTLLAVFVATSDEAFSILIASDKRLALIPLILFKILYGLIVGFVANAIFFRRPVEEDENFEHEDVCAHCHDHVEKEGGKVKLALERYLLVPLIHSLQTFAYVFVVTLIFGALFAEGGLIGADNLSAFLEKSKYFSPFLTALVGLIPNCASSAVITSAYLSGAISFGAMTAGLVSNAGVGLAVLFKNTKEIKRNLILVGVLYALGVIAGFIVSLIVAATGVTL